MKRSIVYLRLAEPDGKMLDELVSREQQKQLAATPGEPATITTSETLRRLIRREHARGQR